MPKLSVVYITAILLCRHAPVRLTCALSALGIGLSADKETAVLD